MIDVKKLITGFLILATIAVASGLTLSIVASQQSSGSAGTAPASNITIDAGGIGTPVPAYAFVNTGSLQGNAAEVLSYTQTTSTAVIASDPANLTNIFANSFVNDLQAANPSGIATDQSGTPIIATPNEQVLVQSITANPAVQNLTIPNWDLEAQSQLITVSTSSSPASIAQYSTSLASIFNQNFVASGIQSDISNQSADPAILPNIESEVQNTLGATLALQVPAKLATFQQDLVRVLVYEKNMVQLAQSANADPVKTALIYEGEKSKYTAAVADLQQQIEKASTLGLSLNNKSGNSVPFIAQILGIEPAHAQWLTFDATTFAQMMEEYINNIVLQILKNTLIALIQRKVLTAIQGVNGVPNFVTDYAAEMVSAYESSAFNTLNADIGGAPPYQVPALGFLLSSPFQNPSTLSNLITSPDPTIQNQNNGTFTNFSDYLALFGSGGNVWGNAMTIQDNAINAGITSYQANQVQNSAQQGWKGGGVCDDGSNPNGYTTLCENSSGQYLPSTNGQCSSSDIVVNIPNGGMCSDGTSPQITSPGQVTGQSMNAAIRSGISLITGATDITGLVTSLAESLISQLAQQAIGYANSVVYGSGGSGSTSGNSGLGGISSSTITSGGTSSSTQTAVQCLPSIQTMTISTSTGTALATVSAIGGKVNTACVTNNSCPSTINSDGTPIYNWAAPGSVQATNGTTLTGSSLTLSYSTPGTYTATVTASTDGTQSSCQINVVY